MTILTIISFVIATAALGVAMANRYRIKTLEKKKGNVTYTYNGGAPNVNVTGDPRTTEFNSENEK